MFEFERSLLSYKAMSVNDMQDAFGLDADIAKEDSSKVYFIGNGKLVYIGYTRRADARVTELQSMSPVALGQPVIRPGTVKLRNFLQDMLVYFGYHHHGEWFEVNALLTHLLDAEDWQAAIEGLICSLKVEVTAEAIS